MMTSSTDWDWVRLQKALAVEAERGFTDLMGKQYRFSEFLCLSLGQSPPAATPPTERRRTQELAAQFARYPQLALSERQHLVAETRRFLLKIQRILEAPSPSPPQVPRTAPLAGTSGPRPGLNQPLRDLSGIGPSRSEQLGRLGLVYVRDLLFYYPRDYIDYARQVKIAQLVAGETVTVVGTIKRCTCFTSPKNQKLTIFELQLEDGTGSLKLSRFFAGGRFNQVGWQQKYKRQYPVGAIAAASGLVKQSKYGFTLENPEIEVLESSRDAIESVEIGRVLPVYALTDGVTAEVIRKAMVAILPAIAAIRDPLPAPLREEYGLLPLQPALENIHFPGDAQMLARARRRLVFDEFFYLQLGFLQRRQKYRHTQTSAPFVPQGQLSDRFSQLLPFALTQAQQRAINEILQDLRLETPMNRLVQGDVGSGKTVVAVYAILAAIQSGYQAALMAPTEVLAEQHYRKLVGWFNQLYLSVELLVGSTKTRKRREIHEQLETGQLPLLVGTHALIQDGVKFQRLGLVVIDEQHRFGVQQRARLLAKGQAPHVLTMTATPIPRTLALTLHGDLDITQIDELPPGRRAIQTTVLTGRERSQAFELIRREVAQGRQAYVILPTIEESDKLDGRAAVEEHQRLSQNVFPELQVGLLHGRLNSSEKEAALTAFRDNQTQILVSTTVVEVGVDVPNATVMLIENAERFGLSQLHQLRGRVGRGSHQSYCLLIASTKNPEANQRLKVLEQSQDGFFIAEMDLRLRGPGEVLGTRQSGLPDFALASLVEDQEVLNLARSAAEKLLFADETLQGLPGLRKELEARYQRLMGGEILT